MVWNIVAVDVHGFSTGCHAEGGDCFVSVPAAEQLQGEQEHVKNIQEDAGGDRNRALDAGAP
jgi:hypothetical protein